MKIEDHIYAVVMAGGSGTRLWPVSRRDHPKHTLPLVGGQSLFQTTVERLSKLFKNEKILIVTTSDQFDILHEQTPGIPVNNFLLEPNPRGTASVAGLAAAVINARDPEAIMALFPSDHHISNSDLFINYMKLAFRVAEMEFLVTLGIQPTYPATGYGYIQKGNSIEGDYSYPVFNVVKFKEKPGEQQAEEMLKSDVYSWNSGIFIWKTSKILEEFLIQMPALRRTLDRIITSLNESDSELILQQEWEQLEVQTIDFGIMESAQGVAVIPTSGLGWNDIGSWDSLFEVLDMDNDHNIVFNSEIIEVDTNDSLVYGAKNNRLVATIGVDNLIIVDSDDILLVCKRHQSQHVKEIVRILKEKNQGKYL
jgi:mannose-1-phosphate guanylyltransferase